VRLPVPSVYYPRRTERQPVHKIVHLLAESEGEVFGAGAYTIDLSALGSRVHTVLNLAPGQTIEFQPQGSDSVIRCRVVWTGKTKSGQTEEAGLEFLETFPAPGEA
jgi:hypothetical protein